MKEQERKKKGAQGVGLIGPRLSITPLDGQHRGAPEPGGPTASQNVLRERRGPSEVRRGCGVQRGGPESGHLGTGCPASRLSQGHYEAAHTWPCFLVCCTACFGHSARARCHADRWGVQVQGAPHSPGPHRESAGAPAEPAGGWGLFLGLLV